MTMAAKPQGINSVLARFEKTIEQNNAAGQSSGMYLTNNCSGANGIAVPDRGRPVKIKPGAYRTLMLPDKKAEKENGESTVQTADTENSEEYHRKSSANRRNNDDSSTHSSCSDSFAFDEDLGDFDEPDFEAAEESAPVKQRKVRPAKEKRSAGRLGNKKTRAGTRPSRRSSVSTPAPEEEPPKEESSSSKSRSSRRSSEVDSSGHTRSRRSGDMDSSGHSKSSSSHRRSREDGEGRSHRSSNKPDRVSKSSSRSHTSSRLSSKSRAV